MKKTGFQDLAAFLILTAISLAYPLLALKIFGVPVPFEYTVKLFTPALISLLAFALIFLDIDNLAGLFYQNRLIFFLCVGTALIAFVHFFKIEKYTFEYLCYAFLWVFLPILAYLYSDAFLKMLPFYLSLLWLINLIYNFLEYFFIFKSYFFMTGLPGNSNWNAALIVVTTPFAAYYFHNRCYSLLQNKLLSKGLALLIIFVSLSFQLLCHSKASCVTVVFALTMAILLSTPKKMKRYIVSGGLIFALSAIAFLYFSGYLDNATDILAVKISEDARPSLWEAACRLIKDNPLTGVSPTVFESKYGAYLPVEYFLKNNVAVRHNHPHNHFLFMASSFGLVAFCSWAIMLLYPIILFIMNYKKSPLILKLIFFSFSALLFHAMFDLVIFEWPCNFIFLIMLGIIWKSVWPVSNKGFCFNLKTPKAIIRGIGALALLAAIFSGWLNLKSSNYLRNALIASEKGNNEIAAVFFDKALKTKKTPAIIYRAGVHSFGKLKNPDLTLHYMFLLNRTPIENYAYNNAFIAKAYCLKGDFKKGLKYFNRETANAPLSVILWYNKFLVCRRLGLKEKAFQCYNQALESLKLKGLNIKDLPEILKNPDYDRKPYLLRLKKKTELNKK